MPPSRSIVAALELLVVALSGCSKSKQTPRYMVATANPPGVGGSRRDAEGRRQCGRCGGRRPTRARAGRAAIFGAGGGAFLMFFDARRNKVHAIDGREKAPLQAGESLFLAQTGSRS